MVFNYKLGITEINNNRVNINYREAVRGIIFRDNKLLMVHSNNGDYKFPGGGAVIDEIHEDTLKREVKEETGHIVTKVKDNIGLIIERHPDHFKIGDIFEMVSSYYLCEVSHEKTSQKLDLYEKELGFNPVWVTLDEAISSNENILNSTNNTISPWVYRETLALKAIKDNFDLIKNAKVS